jgi:aspartate/methionine/tyrosine aminotransferase
MDIVSIPGSRIIEIARIAFATPDVDLLCFGESDQPSPAVAHDAAVAALAAGDTRYPDVRGLPALRDALAHYLTQLHARPVAESRIQITASGMTAVSVALAAVVRAGDRVVLHSPAWPNVGNAAWLRGAQVDELQLTALPGGRFHLDLDRLDALLQGARVHSQQSEQPHRLDRHARRAGGHSRHRATAWRLADFRRGIFAPGL